MENENAQKYLEWKDKPVVYLCDGNKENICEEISGSVPDLEGQNVLFKKYNLYIPRGVLVYFYKQKNFTGEKISLVGPYMSNHEMKPDISKYKSLRVISTGNASWAGAIYHQKNFHGQPLHLFAGTSYPQGGKKVMKSFMLKPGYSIKFYNKPNMQGDVVKEIRAYSAFKKKRDFEVEYVSFKIGKCPYGKIFGHGNLIFLILLILFIVVGIGCMFSSGAVSTPNIMINN